MVIELCASKQRFTKLFRVSINKGDPFPDYGYSVYRNYSMSGKVFVDLLTKADFVGKKPKKMVMFC